MKAIKENMFIILMLLSPATLGSAITFLIVPFELQEHGITIPIEYYIQMIVVFILAIVVTTLFMYKGLRGKFTVSCEENQTQSPQ